MDNILVVMITSYKSVRSIFSLGQSFLYSLGQIDKYHFMFLQVRERMCTWLRLLIRFKGFMREISRIEAVTLAH
uniref:Uncharacterized protein n=1 Tax=Rhizophagus irregularis (strain DAOM 181602 / DAOM 197198 / MUCL 43194) TaxID=747089 RepID=U9TVM9_RHIID